jgi:hypothetical protein
MKRRPISITLISWLFIAVGAGNLIKAFWTLVTDVGGITGHDVTDSALVVVSGLMALASGIFMLRAANWARWLIVVWLALHVVISIGHARSQLIVHSLLMVIMVFLLFRASASAYFRGGE